MKYCLVIILSPLFFWTHDSIKVSKKITFGGFEYVSGNLSLDRETIKIEKETLEIMKSAQDSIDEIDLQKRRDKEKEIIYWYIKQAEQSKNI